MARSCMFCDGRVNSREHVWPQWILKLGDRHHTIRGGTAERLIRIPGPHAELMVRQVCRHRCNNGWMSALEARAQKVMLPLILDGVGAPSHAERQLIVQWILKTTMVFEFLGPAARRYFTPRDRQSMMTDLHIPPNTSAWLGRYGGTWGIMTGGLEIGPDGSETLPPGGIAYTFTIGKLALQLITVRQTDEGVPRVRLKPGPWSHTLVEIWPLTPAPAFWPPPLTVDDGNEVTLRGLLERFGTNQLTPPFLI